LRPEHPRLFVLAGEEEQVKKMIAQNPEVKNLYDIILKNGETVLKEEPVTYEIKVRFVPTAADRPKISK
jgi:hypothetical protein